MSSSVCLFKNGDFEEAKIEGFFICLAILITYYHLCFCFDDLLLL